MEFLLEGKQVTLLKTLVSSYTMCLSNQLHQILDLKSEGVWKDLDSQDQLNYILQLLLVLLLYQLVFF